MRKLLIIGVLALTQSAFAATPEQIKACDAAARTMTSFIELRDAGVGKAQVLARLGIRSEPRNAGEQTVIAIMDAVYDNPSTNSLNVLKFYTECISN